MRKRIVIAAVAIVVVGVLAYVVSRPKRGSVEWHKREVIQAAKGDWRDRAHNLWNRVTGREELFHSNDRRSSNLEALLRLGYLEQREFVVSNRSLDKVFHQSHQLARTDRRWRRLQKWFIDVDRKGTNVVVVVATREDMPILSEAIGKADVP